MTKALGSNLDFEVAGGGVFFAGAGTLLAAGWTGACLAGAGGAGACLAGAIGAGVCLAGTPVV